MQRRSLLKLGAASAAVLLIAGGAAALIEPGLTQGRLSMGARPVIRAIAAAFLEGVLPLAPAQESALDALIERVDGLIAGLPGHARDELGQLLSVLQAAPGRRALAGLAAPWSEATLVEVQAALQSMRESSLELRRQSYQALHDIVGGAYFSESTTWSALGYPGPRSLGGAA